MMRRKYLAVLAIAVGMCVQSATAQFSGANSSLIGNLGSSGPGNFAVLSLGGKGALVNINLATVVGNVGVPNFGTLKESAPSAVSGEINLATVVGNVGVPNFGTLKESAPS